MMATGMVVASHGFACGGCTSWLVGKYGNSGKGVSYRRCSALEYTYLGVSMRKLHWS
jgi:hypothetical protein